MLRKVGAAALVALLGGACAAGTPQPEGQGEAADSKAPGTLSDAELEERFAREADPIQKHPVQGAGLWRAYLEAKVPPKVEPRDKYIEITADVGWDEALTCYVYEDTIDAGAASHAMVREAGKAVEFRALTPYHLAGAGLNPVLGIRGIYQVERDGVVAAGDYKVMVMPRLEFPVLCTHDAPGYSKSFARVTTDFAESFEFESKMPEPMRAELWHATLEDVPVGFSQRFNYELEAGQVRSISIAARFVPTAPGEIAFEDVVEVVNWDRSGALVSGKYLSFENGESGYEMDLKQGKGGYEYSGTVQNKPISGKFRSKKPIVGQLALERRLKKLAGSTKKTRFDQWEYLPGLDPAQGSQVSYEIVPQGGIMLVEASMGQRALVMQANGRGVLKQMLFAVGPRQVQIELVQEVGEL